MLTPQEKKLIPFYMMCNNPIQLFKEIKRIFIQKITGLSTSRCI